MGAIALAQTLYHEDPLPIAVLRLSQHRTFITTWPFRGNAPDENLAR